MKTCTNHPEKQSYSICKNCGKPYCSDCLNEGEEYYYCDASECQKALAPQTQPPTQPEPLPESITCPKCNDELELDEDERISRKVYCPDCEVMLDYNFTPVKVEAKGNYVELLTTMNVSDIAVIKSILDNADIDYYVLEENFVLVRPLVQGAKFMINEADSEKSIELLKDYELNVWGTSARTEE